MSQWLNNYTILQDLSVAQGRSVPGRIDGIIRGNDRPPPIHYAEDTQEQYFREYTGARETPASTPDFGLIQKMLDMVRLDPAPQQYSGPVRKPSMLNPNSAELVPPHYRSGVGFHDNRWHSYQIDTNKKERNVAMKSILEASGGAPTPKRNKDLVLLRPDDIMSSYRKSNIYNEMPPRNSTPMHPLLSMQPSEMFKRKPPSPKVTPVMESNKNTYQWEEFQPTEYALEYYNKFMEGAKLKTYYEEDIWTRAEKTMKEIDKKRKIKSDQLSADSGWKQDDLNLNLVRLPYHRHVIAEQCIVCIMVKKHNIDIDKFLSLAMRVYTS